MNKLEPSGPELGTFFLHNLRKKKQFTQVEEVEVLKERSFFLVKKRNRNR